MQDVKVTKSVINERQELAVSLLVKKWDYTKGEYHLLCNAKIQGDLLDFKIIWFEKWNETEERKQKLKDLYFNMKLYSDHIQEKLEIVEQELYAKYKIQSRTELSDSELDQELEFYSNGKFIS